MNLFEIYNKQTASSLRGIGLNEDGDRWRKFLYLAT